MIVLVSDTSVLIDLERGDLLEATFSCGYTMIVPEQLYERELENFAGPYLCKLGLEVVSLTQTELELSLEIKRNCPVLSQTDSFALACAHRPNHTLLTGDRRLRSEAQKRACRVHGLLWMLDQIDTSGSSTRAALVTGLNEIIAHPNCRLPKDEVMLRLDRWAGH